MLWIPRRRFKRIALGTAQILTIIFTVIFIVFPLIFKFSYRLQRNSVFLFHAMVDPDSDFVHPSKYELAPARNFYLTTDDGVTLGVWHILPHNLYSAINTTDEQEPYPDAIINNGQDIVIYCHGNAGNRVNDYRIELYKVLRRHFHVIAFDYRSYGDSSPDEPSESKVVEDALFIYRWFANKTKANVFVWGHSLGTNIAIQVITLVQERHIKRPIGLFLEAPFNCMKDEIGEFSIAKLYEAAQDCRRSSQGSVIMRTFEKRHQYNHRHICRDPEIHDIIRKFVDRAIQESRSIDA